LVWDKPKRNTCTAPATVDRNKHKIAAEMSNAQSTAHHTVRIFSSFSHNNKALTSLSVESHTKKIQSEHAIGLLLPKNVVQWNFWDALKLFWLNSSDVLRSGCTWILFYPYRNWTSSLLHSRTVMCSQLMNLVSPTSYITIIPPILFNESDFMRHSSLRLEHRTDIDYFGNYNNWTSYESNSFTPSSPWTWRGQEFPSSKFPAFPPLT